MTTKITFEVNAEKYKALIKYSEKKNIDIQNEVVSYIDKLYKKTVPVVVREYIES